MRQCGVRKTEWMILAALALLALALLFLLQGGGKSDYAAVYVGSSEVQRIPLSQDGIYAVDGDLPVTLEVSDGGIRFVHSRCPDLLCEGFGRITEPGRYAICMPARVSVFVRSEEE